MSKKKPPILSENFLNIVLMLRERLIFYSTQHKVLHLSPILYTFSAQ